jgi:hypothetical protein
MLRLLFVLPLIATTFSAPGIQRTLDDSLEDNELHINELKTTLKSLGTTCSQERHERMRRKLALKHYPMDIIEEQDVDYSSCVKRYAPNYLPENNELDIAVLKTALKAHQISCSSRRHERMRRKIALSRYPMERIAERNENYEAQEAEDVCKTCDDADLEEFEALERACVVDDVQEFEALEAELGAQTTPISTPTPSITTSKTKSALYHTNRASELRLKALNDKRKADAEKNKSFLKWKKSAKKISWI